MDRDISNDPGVVGDYLRTIKRLVNEPGTDYEVCRHRLERSSGTAVSVPFGGVPADYASPARQ